MRALSLVIFSVCLSLCLGGFGPWAEGVKLRARQGVLQPNEGIRPSSSFAAGAEAADGGTLIRPPAIPAGSVVGFVSPAGALPFSSEDERRQYRSKVQSFMERIGLRVEFGRHAFGRNTYFSGTDEERAADFMEFIRNPNIAAVFCNRGGYGSARILELLDFDAIRENPKPIMGYSDITALLNAIHRETGLVTFHGPMGVDNWSNGFNAQQIRTVLMNGESNATFSNPDAVVIKDGRVRGKLIGGNLVVFNSLIGSDYLDLLNDGEPKILFLEEVGEDGYRMDRLFLQLKLSGVLEQIQGFIFGSCSGCNPSSGLRWEDIVESFIRPLNIPAIRNARFGHNLSGGQFILPLGSEVELDATAKKIILLQPPVVTSVDE